MKKILIYDVAAEDGGGMFVLKSFYEDVKNSILDIEWTFFVSTNILEPTDKIQVNVFKSVKKSWLNRWWFENRQLPTLIREGRFDIIISLQNMPVKKCNVPQLVYLHQSLQYCPKHFSLLKSEERSLAFRQKFICRLIKKNIKFANHIFVQTDWIRKATIEWCGINEDKISVVPVSFDNIKFPIKKYTGQKSHIFFYPARAEKYKNHMVVVEACRLLSKKGIENYKVLFTISSNSGSYAKSIIENSQGLPIEFIGVIEAEKIWDYYCKSILLFPSYLETCGLPLLEAKAAGAKILTSDLPFSHEALDDYPNVMFFKYDDAQQLSEKMISSINNSYFVYNQSKRQQANSLLNEMLNNLRGLI